MRPHQGNALRAEIRFPKLSKLPAIIARLRRVFDLGANPQAIAEQLVEDAVLAPRVLARPGLRVPGAWDGFELAVRAVLGRGDHGERRPPRLPAASSCITAIRSIHRFATAGLTHVFPRPSRLARVNLAALGMPKARAAALSGLAAAVNSDSRPPRVERESRDSHRTAAPAPRRRRVDRAIHRDACIPRAGRLSGRTQETAGKASGSRNRRVAMYCAVPSPAPGIQRSRATYVPETPAQRGEP